MRGVAGYRGACAQTNPLTESSGDSTGYFTASTYGCHACSARCMQLRAKPTNSLAEMHCQGKEIPRRAALAIVKPEKAREFRLRVAAVTRTANVGL
jgi:hypothetical protein